MTESTKPAYTKPLPDMRPEGDHWWAAMKEHKLLLPTDPHGKPFWYPRALVPGTLEPTQWTESKGTGTVYTYSIHYFGPSKAYKGEPPHTVVLIDLDDGPRMMSILVKDEEGYPSIGCAPCTSKPAEGADPRSGRWQGLNKTECGLHAS